MAEVKKNDSENITAQGDATLSGAVYGLYRDGESYSVTEDVMESLQNCVFL